MTTLQQVVGAAGTARLVSIYAMVSADGDLLAGMRSAFFPAALVSVGAIVFATMMRKPAPGPGDH